MCKTFGISTIVSYTCTTVLFRAYLCQPQSLLRCGHVSACFSFNVSDIGWWTGLTNAPYGLPQVRPKTWASYCNIESKKCQWSVALIASYSWAVPCSDKWCWYERWANVFSDYSGSVQVSGRTAGPGHLVRRVSDNDQTKWFTYDSRFNRWVQYLMQPDVWCILVCGCRWCVLTVPWAMYCTYTCYI